MATNAVLFGSVGSIVHCSELQRGAFDQAIRELGYAFTWDRDAYVASLVNTGGKKRLADYAASQGIGLNEKDLEAIHGRKTEITVEQIRQNRLSARPGVIKLLTDAKACGVKTAFVTTTHRELVDAILESTTGLSRDLFDFIMSKDDEPSYGGGKPTGDPYLYALKQLGVSNAVALEDSQISLESAYAAGIPCVCVPNENTGGQDYSKAAARLQELGEDVSLAELLAHVSPDAVHIAA